MLQIKKKSLLTLCKYNLQFLFKNKTLSKTYRVKKTKTQEIILRAPKNFNIGKQKFFTLNYKTPKLVINLNDKFNLYSLFNVNKVLLKILTKNIQLTPTILVKSIKFTIKTQFKLMWLEI